MVAKQFKCTYNLYRKLFVWLISTAGTFTADLTTATTTVAIITSTVMQQVSLSFYFFRLPGGPRNKIPRNRNDMTSSLDTRYTEQHFNGPFQQLQR